MRIPVNEDMNRLLGDGIRTLIANYNYNWPIGLSIHVERKDLPPVPIYINLNENSAEFTLHNYGLNVITGTKYIALSEEGLNGLKSKFSLRSLNIHREKGRGILSLLKLRQGPITQIDFTIDDKLLVDKITFFVLNEIYEVRSGQSLFLAATGSLKPEDEKKLSDRVEWVAEQLRKLSPLEIDRAIYQFGFIYTEKDDNLALPDEMIKLIKNDREYAVSRVWNFIGDTPGHEMKCIEELEKIVSSIKS